MGGSGNSLGLMADALLAPVDLACRYTGYVERRHPGWERYEVAAGQRDALAGHLGQLLGLDAADVVAAWRDACQAASAASDSSRGVYVSTVVHGVFAHHLRLAQQRQQCQTDSDGGKQE